MRSTIQKNLRTAPLSLSRFIMTLKDSPSHTLALNRMLVDRRFISVKPLAVFKDYTLNYT